MKFYTKGRVNALSCALLNWRTLANQFTGRPLARGRLSLSASMNTITEPARAWLTAALDPFHDDQLHLEGFPDLRSAPSVVQLHNQEYTLSAPASAGAGLWDAKISFTGFDTTVGSIPGVSARKSARGYEYDHAALVAGVPFGALNMRTGAAGAGFSACAPAIVGDVGVGLGSMVGGDRGRLIAAAFEVHNTTAEVYKQGSVTIAMLPTDCGDAVNVFYRDKNAAPWSDSQAQGDQSAVFCSTRAALAAIPTSNTWQAAKGCYVVPRMVKMPIYDARPVSELRTPIVYASDGTAGMIEPTTSEALTTSSLPQFPSALPNSFSPVEAYFSGLSNQTTLTVKFRTIVEYFPAAGSALLPLSTPSTPYDPVALALYSRVVRDAPYAVPVNQNAAGDYFRTILGIIRGVAPTVAPFLGHYAPIALGVGSLAAAAEKMLPRKKVQEAKNAVSRSQAGAKAMATRR